ncbi:hypothetical protein BLNAU_24184 [Blattamonas nauphoetae]|uniref:Serine-threonine/tyrosine-protein kinase catalytic domain-containing protein n=1 Tax=Blattamonas nauphoetae TaxID=2049346 RepID=A0ABQ9WN50_9EUKA|nr:hypothetical protein BLNAU_24184 [Blattamonas nauphoetae]
MEEALPCNGDWKKTVFCRKIEHCTMHFTREEMGCSNSTSATSAGSRIEKSGEEGQRSCDSSDIDSSQHFFDSKENVCFKLNLDITPLPISTHKPQPDDQNLNKLSKSMNQLWRRTNRSRRPSVGTASERRSALVCTRSDLEQATHQLQPRGSFSLGLLLWEMETGCVPFGEHDAVNASRQIVTGVQPKLELVKNNEMRELISQCLNLEPHDRPDLDAVETTLTFLPPHQSIHLITLAQS